MSKPDAAALLANFGRCVRDLRRRREWTQAQLGKRAGLSYKFVGEVERGRGNPTLTTMASLAVALRCELADLLAPRGREATRHTLTASDVAGVEAAIRALQAVLVQRRPRGRAGS